MKQVMKKVLVLTLCLAMCLTLFAGCGSSEYDDVIFIGASGPLTGAAATYGISVRNGAQIAVDEINAAGGINGMQIYFEMADDEHDTQRANTVVNTLIDDGMQVFMGAVTTAPSLEVGELTHDANIFQITPSASAAACAQYDNQFRICFTDPLQGTLSAQFVEEYFSSAKVGILYDSSDAYSTGIYEAFVAEYSGSATVQSFTSETNIDFSAQISAFQSAGCDVVFCPFYAEQAVAVFDQSASKSYAPTFIGCDGLDGIIPAASSTEIVEGVIYLTPFLASATDSATSAFVSAYEAAYSATPDQFAADGYDAIYTIAAAIEKAGVTDASIDASELCDLMKVSMTQITVEGLTGTTTWSADGEPTKAAMFVQVQSGEAVAYN